MAERFSFYDNDTGVLIQSAESGPIDGFPSGSRAVATLDSATSTLEGNDAFDIARYEVMRDKSHFGSTHTAKVESFFTIKSEDVSPCLGKPRVLAPTHFYANHASYSEVRSEIDHALVQRSELVFSTFPQNQMWKCKYLDGANVREMHITCFFDAVKCDHIVEVKRVHGDGIFSKYPELFSVLKQAFGVDINNKRMPNAPPLLRSAPPLPCRNKINTVEQFLGSLQCVFSMAKASFLETRLEGVKMLITTLDKPEHVKFVEASPSTCLLPVLDVLLSLVNDSYEEIVEFAVVCLSQLIHRLSHNIDAVMMIVIYEQSALLGSLLREIRNDSVSYEFYLHAHRRRIAVQALQTLLLTSGMSMDANEKMKEVFRCELQAMGFLGARVWEEYVGHILDDKLKSAALSFSAVFDN
jgi:hypothetical protein